MAFNKSILILLTGFFFSINTYAQEFATAKDDFLVDVGFGFGRSHKLYGGNNWNSNINAKTPTFSAVVQKAFWDDITIGAFIAYDVYGGSGTENPYGYSTSWETKESSFFTGLRGEYHFNKLLNLDSKIDLYAGTILGIRTWKNTAEWTYFYTNGNSSEYHKEIKKGNNLETGAFAGARYYFSEGFSAFGELGWALTPLRLGVALKL